MFPLFWGPVSLGTPTAPQATHLSTAGEPVPKQGTQESTLGQGIDEPIDLPWPFTQNQRAPWAPPRALSSSHTGTLVEVLWVFQS